MVGLYSLNLYFETLNNTIIMEEKLTVEKYIWSVKFPHESFNWDYYYDWCSENQSECLKLTNQYIKITQK